MHFAVRNMFVVLLGTVFDQVQVEISSGEDTGTLVYLSVVYGCLFACIAARMGDCNRKTCTGCDWGMARKGNQTAARVQSQAAGPRPPG